MELLIYVELYEGAETRPLRLMAGPGASLAHLQQRLNSLWGVSGQWWVADKPLSVCTLGKEPLVNGCVLRRVPVYRQPAFVTIYAISGPDCGRAWPLQRGSFSLGKFDTDICVNDSALEPLQGHLTVSESGIEFVDIEEACPQVVKVEEVFQRGNTEFMVLGRQLVPSSEAASADPVAVEVDKPRSMLQLILMAVLPMIIGLVVAMITGMWLFLLMSLASTVIMGSHMFIHKGASRSTQRLLAKAAQQELLQLNSYPQPHELVFAPENLAHSPLYLSR